MGREDAGLGDVGYWALSAAAMIKAVSIRSFVFIFVSCNDQFAGALQEHCESERWDFGVPGKVWN